MAAPFAPGPAWRELALRLDLTVGPEGVNLLNLTSSWVVWFSFVSACAYWPLIASFVAFIVLGFDLKTYIDKVR